jgi:hypothetical protein
MVIRKCDFKTFNSWLPRQKGKQRKRPAARQSRRLPAQVSGGFSGGHNWGNLGGRRGCLSSPSLDDALSMSERLSFSIPNLVRTIGAFSRRFLHEMADCYLSGTSLAFQA